jgi:four helix bundle protein
MVNNFKSFESLKTWQLAKEFKNEVYLISKRFPKEELYNLTQQIRRAVISITANIAEGYGRYNYQENIQFCRISRGSLNEMLDHIIVYFDENYINDLELNEFRVLYDDCLRLLNGYISYLQKAKTGSSNQ